MIYRTTDAIIRYGYFKTINNYYSIKDGIFRIPLSLICKKYKERRGIHTWMIMQVMVNNT